MNPIVTTAIAGGLVYGVAKVGRIGQPDATVYETWYQLARTALRLSSGFRSQETLLGIARAQRSAAVNVRGAAPGGTYPKNETLGELRAVVGQWRRAMPSASTFRTWALAGWSTAAGHDAADNAAAFEAAAAELDSFGLANASTSTVLPAAMIKKTWDAVTSFAASADTEGAYERGDHVNGDPGQWGWDGKSWAPLTAAGDLLSGALGAVFGSLGRALLPYAVVGGAAYVGYRYVTRDKAAA
jgi:hypothetical protein